MVKLRSTNKWLNLLRVHVETLNCPAKERSRTVITRTIIIFTTKSIRSILICRVQRFGYGIDEKTELAWRVQKFGKELSKHQEQGAIFGSCFQHNAKPLIVWA